MSIEKEVDRVIAAKELHIKLRKNKKRYRHAGLVHRWYKRRWG